MSQFNYLIFGNNPLYITILKNNQTSKVYFSDHPGHFMDHESYSLNSGVNLFENNITIEEPSGGTFIVKHDGQKLEPVKMLADVGTTHGFNIWLLLFLILLIIILLFIYFKRSR